VWIVSETYATPKKQSANQTTGSSNVYIGAGMSGVAGENGACYIANIFSRCLPPESRSSLTETVNSARPLLPGGLKRRLS